MTSADDLTATRGEGRGRPSSGTASPAALTADFTVDAGEAGARERLAAVTTQRGRRAVCVLAALSLALVPASCGDAQDSRSASGATRPEQVTRRSGTPPRSPDAGIPEGHAAADARARRCRAAHPPRWRFWRYCDRYAR